MLRYNKLSWEVSNLNLELKSKLNKKTKDPFVVILHNAYPYDTLHQTIEVQVAKIEDKTLIGAVSKIDQYKVIDRYYQQLKNKSVDGFAITKIDKQDRKSELNQFHVWLDDSIYHSITSDVRIKTNQILALEKIKKVKTKMFLIILGVLVVSLLGLMLLSIQNMPINITF